MGTVPANAQLLVRVLDGITDPLVIYDRDYRIVMANQALMAIFHRDPEQLIGRHCFELFHGHSAACEECHIRDVFRSGEPQVCEKVIRLPDGRLGHFEIHAYPVKDGEGNITRVVEHARDISEQKNFENRIEMKQVESELRSAKEFSEKIIDNITDGLVVVDPGTHRIVQANASFLGRVGLDTEKVLGRPCYEVMPGRKTPCWEDGIYCPVRESVAIKRPAQCDKVHLNAEGQERMLQVLTYPLVGANGDVELVIRMERDVTEKRRMEEALAFRSKELQKTQHQLETLFEISRRVGAESSLPALVNFLQDYTEDIFPDSDALFLVLEAEGDRFLSFEECRPDTVEPLRRQQEKTEGAGLDADFARHLRTMKDPQVVTSAEGHDLHPLLKTIVKAYKSWFGLPILVRHQCIGYFLLGSKTSTNYSREDLRFFQALFAQIGGHIRNLVLHESEISRLRRKPVEKTCHGEIIGQSKKMLEIYDLIDLVAMSDATVLITGENGTGKELVAQAVHRQNFRRRGPFVVANCSAYSPTLLESELFGHEKGAFTGAIRQKKGRIERAQGGTLFLDEIGDISLATQVLLLRFLQDHCFERVGGEETIDANVRVLAATNRDLRREVEERRFREDLYYRLNVFSINVPPLRERKEDIPLLSRHFLGRFSVKEGKGIREISPDAMQALMDYHWPGNVRQLENAVSYAVILCQGEVIKIKHLPPFLKEFAGDSAETSLSENERQAILRALEESNWNKHEAARRLQVSRSTLYSKIRRHGLIKGAGVGKKEDIRSVFVRSRDAVNSS